jgi:hypothetical protein
MTRHANGTSGLTRGFPRMQHISIRGKNLLFLVFKHDACIITESTYDACKMSTSLKWQGKNERNFLR